MNNKSFPIDAKSSNIRPMSFYEFMHCFERGFITLVGEYADQYFESIIRSKMYDIDQLGFCFWTHRYFYIPSTIQQYRRLLEDSQKDKYLIMTYTEQEHSKNNNYGNYNIRTDENTKDYHDRMWEYANQERVSFAQHFQKYDEDLKIKYKYPRELFPELLEGDDRNTAYCISEFYYLSEYIPLDEMCALFEQFNVTSKQWGKCTYPARPGNRFIRPKTDNIPNEQYEKTDKVWYLIAKLDYPYFYKMC